MVPFITYYVIYQLQSIGFDQTENRSTSYSFVADRGSYKTLGESDSISHSLCSKKTKTKRAIVMIQTTHDYSDDC